MYKAALAQKLAQEEAAMQQQHNFVAHAMPADTIFMPERSDKPLTQIDGFVLATDIRGEERKVFDEETKRRIEFEDAQREEQKRREEVFVG
jgi:hypothetical protein